MHGKNTLPQPCSGSAAEQQQTCRKVATGFATRPFFGKGEDLYLDKKRRSAKEHSSLRDNVKNCRIEYCRNQIAYMSREIERMKLELKNKQNKCCFIMKSRGGLDIQQNEKTD